MCFDVWDRPLEDSTGPELVRSGFPSSGQRGYCNTIFDTEKEYLTINLGVLFTKCGLSLFQIVPVVYFFCLFGNFRTSVQRALPRALVLKVYRKAGEFDVWRLLWVT